MRYSGRMFVGFRHRENGGGKNVLNAGTLGRGAGHGTGKAISGGMKEFGAGCRGLGGGLVVWELWRKLELPFSFS